MDFWAFKGLSQLWICPMISRAVTAGKTAKTEGFPGFCIIERGGGSGGMPVMGLSLS